MPNFNYLKIKPKYNVFHIFTRITSEILTSSEQNSSAKTYSCNLYRTKIGTVKYGNRTELETILMDYQSENITNRLDASQGNFLQ